MYDSAICHTLIVEILTIEKPSLSVTISSRHLVVPQSEQNLGIFLKKMENLCQKIYFRKRLFSCMILIQLLILIFVNIFLPYGSKILKVSIGVLFLLILGYFHVNSQPKNEICQFLKANYFLVEKWYHEPNLSQKDEFYDANLKGCRKLPLAIFLEVKDPEIGTELVKSKIKRLLQRPSARVAQFYDRFGLPAPAGELHLEDPLPPPPKIQDLYLARLKSKMAKYKDSDYVPEQTPDLDPTLQLSPDFHNLVSRDPIIYSRAIIGNHLEHFTEIVLSLGTIFTKEDDTVDFAAFENFFLKFATISLELPISEEVKKIRSHKKSPWEKNETDLDVENQAL